MRLAGPGNNATGLCGVVVLQIYSSSEGRASLQEVANALDETWALVSDMPDAKKRYGTNPCNGKDFNSDFRKMLTRKFDEVRLS